MYKMSIAALKNGIRKSESLLHPVGYPRGVIYTFHK